MPISSSQYLSTPLRPTLLTSRGRKTLLFYPHPSRYVGREPSSPKTTTVFVLYPPSQRPLFLYSKLSMSSLLTSSLPVDYTSCPGLVRFHGEHAPAQQNLEHRGSFTLTHALCISCSYLPTHLCAFPHPNQFPPLILKCYPRPDSVEFDKLCVDDPSSLERLA